MIIKSFFTRGNWKYLLTQTARLPFLLFRIFFLGLAYFVFEPLYKLFEQVGQRIPGLELYDND